MVDKTHEKLPDACTEAFIAMQVFDLQAKREVVWKYIYGAAAACFSGAFVPVPGTTPVTTLASQAGLFVAIAYIYGYKENAHFLLTVLTPTLTSVGTLLSTMVGDLISSVFPAASLAVATGSASYIVAFGLTCTAIFEKMARDNIYGKGKDEVKKYLQDNFRKEFEKYKNLQINSPEALKNIEITFLNPS